IPASFPDGTSNTIAFAESYANCVWQDDPTFVPSNNMSWTGTPKQFKPEFCNPHGWVRVASSDTPGGDRNVVWPLYQGYNPILPNGTRFTCPLFQDRPDWRGVDPDLSQRCGNTYTWWDPAQPATQTE